MTKPPAFIIFLVLTTLASASPNSVYNSYPFEIVKYFEVRAHNAEIIFSAPAGLKYDNQIQMLRT